MADIRLYRKFICVSAINSATTTNTLFNPFSLSAETYTAASGGGTVLETGLIPTQESTGLYYVDLDPNYYAGDVIYELAWKVVYEAGVPERTLPTRFKISTNLVGDDLVVEVTSLPIEVVIQTDTGGDSPIDVEVQ